MIFGGLHASSPAVAFELMWTFDLQCDTCDIPSLLLGLFHGVQNVAVIGGQFIEVPCLKLLPSGAGSNLGS